MTSSAVLGELNADTGTVATGLAGCTVYRDLFAPPALPEARKYRLCESPENFRRAADAAPAGETLVTVEGLETLSTYTESTLAARAMSAIHLPSGLTRNWSLPFSSGAR